MITASIVTYGIQYYKIIKKESIKGINLYMIFMGVISNYLTSLSYLHSNLHDMKNNFAITLDIVQLFIIDFIYILYFTIYLYYTYNNCIILQICILLVLYFKKRYNVHVPLLDVEQHDIL